MSMTQIILLCRQGFEAETAAEIQEHAAKAGCFGYCKTKSDQAWVSYVAEEAQLKKLMGDVSFRDLIFARQWFLSGDVIELPSYDRVSAIIENMEGVPQCGELEVVHGDSNEGKELSRL